MTAGLDAPVVIGLGGNVGTHVELVARFRRAREALEAIAVPATLRSAALYRSAPIGPLQPPFLNTAVALRAPDLQPAELIATLLEIERRLGRDRERESAGGRWGPRPIDLDVLVWGERIVRTPELTIPHARLAERRFALAPLADLQPDLVVPGLGALRSLLDRVQAQAVEHLAATW